MAWPPMFSFTNIALNGRCLMRPSVLQPRTPRQNAAPLSRARPGSCFGSTAHAPPETVRPRPPTITQRGLEMLRVTGDHSVMDVR